MKLFRKKGGALCARDEKLAVKIAGRIILAERMIAATINRLWACLSPKWRSTVLILLCLLYAAYNMYLFISSIIH